VAKPWAARILVPARQGVVTGGAVHVAVELGPHARRFRAWVGDSRVTGAFAGKGLVRKATLRVGRTPGLGYGRRVIYVETFGAEPGQHWWTERHIVVVRPGKGLFVRVAAKRVPGAGARVVATPRRAETQITLQVNGGAPQAFKGKGRRRALRLSGDVGLRPGVNHVVLRAVEPRRGRIQVIRGDVSMPRLTPVAGAGASRRAHSGRPVRFSAAGTKAPPGVRVRYHWRIVRRPAGSKAKLRHASTMHPILRPDRIGHYVLKLRVTGAEGGHGAHASAAHASAVGSEGAPEGAEEGPEKLEPPSVSPEGAGEKGEGTAGKEEPASENGEAATYDTATTTLDATPTAGAIGVPVDTITPSGISIGAADYPAPTPADALQLLVLERTTLAEVSNTSYTNEDSGTAALLAAVEHLSSADLVIITKPQATTNNATDATAHANIVKALAKIGVQPASQAVTNGATACTSNAEQCSAFSAIGVPGIPVGQGSLNDGLSGLTAPSAGDLHGYFQENLAGAEGPDGVAFTFVATERVPFTVSEAKADPAVVTVGSSEPGSPYPVHEYTSATIPTGKSGFFVLILAAGNLGSAKSETFEADAAELTKMHELLKPAVGNRGDLVIVRSIGSVKRVATPGWDLVAQDLQELGVSKYYFNELNGAAGTQWVQVSPGGDPAATSVPDPDTQFAYQEGSFGGSLHGLLSRDDLGQLYPAESVGELEEAKSPLAGSLAGIISLPTAAWPENNWTAGEKEVEKCLAEHLIALALGELRLPIWKNYTNPDISTEWATWKSTITDPGYFEKLTKYKKCEDLSRSDFEAVEEEFVTEWSSVRPVWSMIEQMQSVVREAKEHEVVRAAALEVYKSINGASSRPTKYNTDSIASDALWGLSTIPGFAEETDAINFIASSLALASDLQQQPDGSSAAEELTKASEFAGKLAEQTTSEYTYLKREAEILLQDPNKMVLAARNAINTNLAAANWAWELPQARAAGRALTQSVLRQSYLTLFPTAYSLFRLQGGASSLPANPADYQCSSLDNGYFVDWNPFSTVQQQYGFVHVTTSSSGATEDWTYATPDTAPLSHINKTVSTPSEALLAKIFGLPKEGSTLQVAGSPLFDGIEFAIEAYGNGTASTITVTHSSGGGGKRKTNLICGAGG